MLSIIYSEYVCQMEWNFTRGVFEILLLDQLYPINWIIRKLFSLIFISVVENLVTNFQERINIVVVSNFYRKKTREKKFGGNSIEFMLDCDNNQTKWVLSLNMCRVCFDTVPRRIGLVIVIVLHTVQLTSFNLFSTGISYNLHRSHVKHQADSFFFSKKNEMISKSRGINFARNAAMFTSVEWHWQMSWTNRNFRNQNSK